MQTEEELEAALGEERSQKDDADKADEAASRDASDEHEEQRRAVV